MREFKFRAWLINENEMLYGYNATENGYFTLGFRYRKSEVELMQYTGLKDKNKKDIYEGDIIKYYTAGYETQEHFGNNIPNGYFCEKVDTFIKSEIRVIKFRDGIFGVIDEEDDEILPLLWYVERSHTHVEDHVYDDLIAHEYYKEYGFDSIESVRVALDGCEVIGNVYENPELLNQKGR